MSSSVSWHVGLVKRLTANSHVLCLGHEVVGDATRCEERPQRPENLCEKNGNKVSTKDANWASDHECNQHQPICTYGCRPLAETEECHG
jgi:hypothetical protein